MVLILVGAAIIILSWGQQQAQAQANLPRPPRDLISLDQGPTDTSTPTATATATDTPTDTATPTATATATDTPTDTATPTATATATDTPTDTSTPTATATATNTPTDTSTPTVTVTPTDTSTPTITPTSTHTATPTSTPTTTPTATPTNTPIPSFCPAAAAGREVTEIIGKGMGSTTKAQAVAKVFVPNPNDVVSLYGQLAGKQTGPYKNARFIRPNGTSINDLTKESPAYRTQAVFWYGQNLTPLNLAHWRARLVGAPTKAPFVQRAFILYPTYRTAEPYANVFRTFAISSENQVYWQSANGWFPAQQQILPLPVPTGSVSVTVSVAVVDNDLDNRPFELTISAGGVSQQVSVNGPTHGQELNIVMVTLNNVPAGTAEVVLDLVSPNSIGDSVAMVGATAHYSCEPTS